MRCGDWLISLPLASPNTAAHTCNMKKFLTTLMALAAFNVLADVIIYDNHLIYTTTGENGGAFRMLDSGWTVLDVQTGAATELLLFKSRGIYQVVSQPIEINYFGGASGKQTMVVYVQPSPVVWWPGQPAGASGLGTAAGTTSSLNVGPQTLTAAKTLTVDSNYIKLVSSRFGGTGTLLSTNTYWQTAKGSLTFDSKRTITQNQIDGNYSNIVQRLTQLLISEGYTLPPQLP
jgi:hypothetical protein